MDTAVEHGEVVKLVKWSSSVFTVVEPQQHHTQPVGAKSTQATKLSAMTCKKTLNNMMFLTIFSTITKCHCDTLQTGYEPIHGGLESDYLVRPKILLTSCL